MLAFALALLLGIGATAADPAFVLWTRGDVHTAPAEAAPGDAPPPPAPLAVADALGEGAELILGAEAHARLLVGGAVLVDVTGPGRFRVGATALTRADEAGEVRALPLTGFALGPRPPAAEGPPPAPRALRILSPRQTAITDPEPRLRWRAPDGPGRFDLTLWRLRADGRQQVVEQWKGLGGRAHALSAPLEPGGTYRWTVALHGAAAHVPGAADEAWFEVLAPERVREVEGALSALQVARARLPEEPEGAADGALDVLRALLLESHGLLADAEDTWLSLAAREPSRPELMRAAQRLGRRDLGTPRPQLDQLLPFGIEVRELP